MVECAVERRYLALFMLVFRYLEVHDVKGKYILEKR